MASRPIRRIAVDFDGTLCDMDWPGIGKPKPGGKEALTRLRALGLYIVIYSCRTSKWDFEIFGGSPNEPTLDRPCVMAMKEWLDQQGIPYDEIDDGSRGKPNALFYIDDKGIRFENNWPEIADVITGVLSADRTLG